MTTSVLIFKTAFIKMTRDPSKFASQLEEALNDFARNGWEMIRFEHDMKKGTLLVARKVDAEALKASIPPGHPLAVLFGGGPPDKDGLSPVSERIVNEAFSRAERLDEELNEKSLNAIAAVCRKYPNEVLRAAAGEIKKYAEAHLRDEHSSEAPCNMTSALMNLANGIEKHVAHSVV